MHKRARFIALAALCAAASACSAVRPAGGIDPNGFDDVDLATTDVEAARTMAPQGSMFSQGLREGYFALADQQAAQVDLPDQIHFTRKAVASAKGLNVQPDMPGLRTLPAERGDEFAAARARLLSGLDRGGRLKTPVAAARAQVAYDCWLEETEAGDQAAADACRRSFDDAMREIENGLVTGAGNEYVVFFALDAADVTPVAAKVLDQVATDFRSGRVARVLVAGHADRSGRDAHNLRLSEQRARRVAAELAARGVPSEQTKLEWFGESRPRVPTADGVREAQNRRVEVLFQ
jgi:OOP family OmpA-OmpF porin